MEYLRPFSINIASFDRFKDLVEFINLDINELAQCKVSNDRVDYHFNDILIYAKNVKLHADLDKFI